MKMVQKHAMEIKNDVELFWIMSNPFSGNMRIDITFEPFYRVNGRLNFLKQREKSAEKLENHFEIDEQKYLWIDRCEYGLQEFTPAYASFSSDSNSFWFSFFSSLYWRRKRQELVGLFLNRLSNFIFDSMLSLSFPMSNIFPSAFSFFLLTGCQKTLNHIASLKNSSESLRPRA